MLSQSINSYFVRGAQQIGSSVRLSGGLYDANYSTFGNTLNWRLGISDDLVFARTSCAFQLVPGFVAPLLAERYFFPPIIVNGKPQPNPGVGPEDANCVVPNGNPDERPEHATEYELGYSHLFSQHVKPRRVVLSFEPARHDRELLSRWRRAEFLQ